jgi:hypothetical protein
VKVDPQASAEAKVNAPDVDDLGLEEGIRLTTLFDPERGINYRMPTVEVVPFTSQEKKALSRPDSSREVEASELGNWFKQIYPPGIMKKTGYVKKVTGALTLAPAGKSNAVLKGSVTFFFDDRSSTTYKGGGRTCGVVWQGSFSLFGQGASERNVSEIGSSSPGYERNQHDGSDRVEAGVTKLFS